MPITIIKCDRCHQQWPSHDFWGRYAYEINQDTHIDMERDIGWCDDCHDFRLIEEILTQDELLNAFIKAYDEFITVEKPYKPTIFGLLKCTDSDVLRSYKRLELNLLKARHALKWKDARQSPPRCLSCGSNDVGPYNIFKGDKSTHPVCGGKLTERDPNCRIAIGDQIKVYDTEGFYLNKSIG
jgi:NAD-dependent SIR2 family protein deacetylase